MGLFVFDLLFPNERRNYRFNTSELAPKLSECSEVGAIPRMLASGKLYYNLRR